MEEDGWEKVACDYEAKTTSKRTNRSRMAYSLGQADPDSMMSRLTGHTLIHLSLSFFTIKMGLVDSHPRVVES